MISEASNIGKSLGVSTKFKPINQQTADIKVRYFENSIKQFEKVFYQRKNDKIFINGLIDLSNEIMANATHILYSEVNERRSLLVKVDQLISMLNYVGSELKDKVITEESYKLQSFLALLILYNDNSYGKASSQLDANFTPAIDEQTKKLQQLEIHVKRLTEIQENKLQEINADLFVKQMQKKTEEIKLLEGEIANFQQEIQEKERIDKDKTTKLNEYINKNVSQTELVKNLEEELAAKELILRELEDENNNLQDKYREEIKKHKKIESALVNKARDDELKLAEKLKEQLKNKEIEKNAAIKEAELSFKYSVEEKSKINAQAIRVLEKKFEDEKRKKIELEEEMKRIKKEYERKTKENDEFMNKASEKEKISRQSILELQMKLDKKEIKEQELENTIEQLNKNYNQNTAKTKEQYSLILSEKAAAIKQLEEKELIIASQKNKNRELTGTVKNLEEKIVELKKEIEQLKQRHKEEKKKLENQQKEEIFREKSKQEKAIDKLSSDLLQKEEKHKKTEEILQKIKVEFDLAKTNSIKEAEKMIQEKNKLLEKIAIEENRNALQIKEKSSLELRVKEQKIIIKKMKDERTELLRDIEQEKEKNKNAESKYKREMQINELMKSRINTSQKMLELIKRAFKLLTLTHSTNTAIMASFLSGLLGAVTKNHQTANLIKETTETALNNLSHTLGQIEAAPEEISNVESSDLSQMYENGEKFYGQMEEILTERENMIEDLLQNINEQVDSLLQVKENNNEIVTVSEEEVVNESILNFEALEKSIVAEVYAIENDIHETALHDEAQRKIEEIIEMNGHDSQINNYSNPINESYDNILNETQRNRYDWNGFDFAAAAGTEKRKNEDYLDNLYFEYRYK